ncbi:MAG TPA: hypothetical protein VJT73_20740 [Polyangiaceae bacterium]|nr:hypothetical protein [Polyangiaceae bacterium]
MNEESLAKRTLVVTGKLVGAFALWVAIVSFIVVAVTGKVVLALSGGSADHGSTTEEGARATDKNPPGGSKAAASALKPNG